MPYKMHKKVSRDLDYTFQSLYTQYMELNRPYLSAHEIKNRESMWKNHLSMLGNIDVRSLKYSTCQKFINSLLDKGLKPKTVKNLKSFLQVITKIALLDGEMSSNPFQFVRMPNISNRYKIPLNEAEQKRLIRAILSFDEPLYKDIFLLLLHGRRLGEVLKLRWEDIDLNRHEYTIPAHNNKARRDMTYKMTASLFSALSRRYTRQVEWAGNLSPCDFVFPNPRTKKPFSDVRRAWKRLLKSACLPHTKLHSLRHVIGSYAINVLEIPIEKISDTLGHSSISTTQIYINHRASNSKEVISKLFDSALKA